MRLTCVYCGSEKVAFSGVTLASESRIVPVSDLDMERRGASGNRIFRSEIYFPVRDLDQWARIDFDCRDCRGLCCITAEYEDKHLVLRPVAGV